MTASVRIRCSFLAAVSFLGGSEALTRRCRYILRCFPVATVDTHRAIVNLANTTVGFTAVARPAQQLNIGGFTAAAARKGHNMIVLQINCTATAPARSAITGINNFFSGL